MFILKTQIFVIYHQKRSCIIGSHVLETNCTVGENFRLVSWVIPVRTQMGFPAAEEFCWNNHEALIWCDIDGDPQGLEPMHSLLGDYFWIAVSDFGHEGSWFNMRGENVTEFVSWRHDEPNNVG